jgi:hypothetical protein
VFRIRDILVRIRIFGWIRTLFADPVPAPDPPLIASHFEDGYRKIINLFKFFLLITFCGHIYISLQRQQVIKKSQNSRNQRFSYFFFFFLLMEGSGSVEIIKDPEAQKNMDPEH